MRSSVISQVWSIARVGTISDRRGDRLRSISAGSFSCRCAYIAKSIDGKWNLDSMASMKTRICGLTLVFCFSGWATCFAADPLMGTWNLNEAKSKITTGTMKDTHVVYSSMFGQVKITSDGIAPSGKPIHVEWAGKFDGKDYPVTGD